jgi:hypothetical protein
MKSDNEFDFGFTSVSEATIKVKEAIIEEKVNKIYKMILPLLMNLKKDADKNEYIYWPNRVAKIDEFINKLEKIIKS